MFKTLTRGLSPSEIRTHRIPRMLLWVCLLLSLYCGGAGAQSRLVRAWGSGSFGQRGDSTTTTIRTVPRQSKGPGETSAFSGATVITGGEGHTVALRSNGTLYAWGFNGQGQLGDATNADRTLPVQVVGPNNIGALTGITTLSAGQYHVIALRSDGTVWTWGNNASGQLGDGTSTNRNTPTQVHGVGDVGFLTEVTAIAAGGSHSLAVRSDGTVYAWGDSGSGQLGDGTTTSRNAPVQVMDVGGSGFLTGVIAVAGGYIHTLALKSDGTVCAWGSNVLGQLGDGTGTSRSTPVQVHGVGNVGFLTGISAITCGSGAVHNVVRATSGAVYAWGYNDFALGDGTATSRYSPVQVHGVGNVGFLTDVVSIATGNLFTLASQADGTVLSWGSNGSSRLGDGTNVGQSAPAPVHGVGNVGNLTGGVSVGCGYYHGLAVKSDGTVFSWGYNNYGQAGNGTTTNHSTPVQVGPVSIAAYFADAQALACGTSHTLALKPDGTLWAWGYNGYGQLGDGTTVGQLMPRQVHGVGDVGYLTDVVAMAGGNHSLALKSDGTVYAWGDNGYGQIGAGPVSNQSLPVQVHGVGNVGFLTGIVALASGYYHSLALKSDGTVWAWGGNSAGEIGDGTGTSRNTPVQVKGVNGNGYLTGVMAVAGGLYYSMALKSDGTVYAWGRNVYGELGNGVVISQNTPVQVKGVGGVGFLTDVVALACGHDHALALKSDGTVYAWGRNNYGQLGDGTTTDRNTPVQVVGVGGVGVLTEVVSLSGGDSHTVALTSDGAVYAWGLNGQGQLGDGTTTDRNTPLQVLGSTGVGALENNIVIAAGDTHTVALRAEGVIQGGVSLDSLTCVGAPLRFEFRPVGGGDPILQTVAAGPAGVFSFSNVPEGLYDIAVKGSKWLRQTKPNISTVGGGNVLNLRINLLGGDANDDNSVDVFDLDLLIQAFNSVAGDPNWNNGVADFNCDESVDVFDLDLLIRNFNQEGDS